MSTKGIDCSSINTILLNNFRSYYCSCMCNEHASISNKELVYFAVANKSLEENKTKIVSNFQLD